ncbi:MAG: toll/interleukin-1 receptor domain-containing protein [Bacillota bacterium]|nr:toll/interleukin-1 receptor domain-containing protein [Bacillota bacterium]
MSVYESVLLSELGKVLRLYAPCWGSIEFATVLYLPEEGCCMPLAMQIRARDGAIEEERAHGATAIPESLRMVTKATRPSSGIELLLRILNREVVEPAGMEVSFRACKFGRAAFLGTDPYDHLLPNELHPFVGPCPKLFLEASLFENTQDRDKLYQRLQQEFDSRRYDYPTLSDASNHLLRLRTSGGYCAGSLEGALKIPVRLEGTLEGARLSISVDMPKALEGLRRRVRFLARSESGDRYVQVALQDHTDRGNTVLFAAVTNVDRGDQVVEVTLDLEGRCLDLVRIPSEPVEASLKPEPHTDSTAGTQREVDLRYRILRYLLSCEHLPGSPLAELDEIAQEFRLSEADISDQIDILESLGAVVANRTFGGAAPTLTGRGKALLEELEQAHVSASLSSKRENTQRARSQFDWDVFISHASEDKESFVMGLAHLLREKGVRVWYDEFTLTVGDSLRRSIDKGLAKSRYGVVVLSPRFFAKEWPQKELDGLVARERDGEKVILPVWLDVDTEAVAGYSPMLADRVAAKAEDGLEKVSAELLKVLRQQS